ncbi:insulinase family protein [Psychroflexus tropicus]|uniref:insulinase family protein n=1 Tax=Psychroflexus tropicus TaxID=197345 RepID=UPI00039D4B09|nr:insulinase family protein [Psychroflexus tropicus]
MKLLLILLLSFKFSLSFSQADAPVIMDTLDNGFTYYIKPMNKANGQIYMDIHIRSGSNRQKKDEFDFAHFIEHLPFTAFRTKAYNENGKLEEAIRSKSFNYGGSTGHKYTSFYFYFPASNAFLQDQGLTFLKETLFGELFPTKENFEAEKGALYQEGAKVYFGLSTFQDHMIRTKFSECVATPIIPDLMWSHIQNFKISEAKDFIKKWYRPELSTLVVVGEIDDLNHIRTEIRKKFSTSNKSEPIQTKICKETLSTGPPKFMAIDNQIKDPEFRSEVKIHLFKKEDLSKSKLSESQWEYLKPILNQTIGNFFWKHLDSYNSPTRTVVRRYVDFPVLDITIKSVLGEEEKSIQKTFKLLNLLKYQGISKKEWSKIHNQKLEALNLSEPKSSKGWQDFLENKSLGKSLSAKEKKELLAWWQKFSMEDFNRALRRLLDQPTKDFLVIAPFSSDFGEAYWKEKTKAWLTQYDPNFLTKKQNQQTDYKELEKDPLGSRVFEFANGQKVIIKEFLDQEREFLEFHAFQDFGANDVDPENYYEAMLAPKVIQNAGVGQLNKYELKEVMTINSIQKIAPYVTETESGIKGKLGSQNLSVFFDLLQDYIDSPRKDSLAFKDWQLNQWRSYLNPGIDRSFSDTRARVNKILKLPRKRLGVHEKYKASKKITMQNAYHVYDMIFGNSEDFTILISSSYKAEQLLPYITKRFVGPNNKERVSKNLTSTSSSKQRRPTKTIKVSSIPNANAMLALKYIKRSDPSDWKNRLKIEILKKALSDRLFEIRYVENKAMYYWKASYYYQKVSEQANISVFIPTLEEQVEEVSNEVDKIIRDLKRKELSEEQLDKIKISSIRPKYINSWEQNPVKTLGIIHDYYQFNTIPPQKSEVENFIESIRPKDIKTLAKEMFTKANKKEIVALP